MDMRDLCASAPFQAHFFSVCVGDAFGSDLFRFVIAILIGAVTAGIFGLIIGIPVLRLRGDYLAIVTLAFGEIIKNVINALYVGRDSKGFHISLSPLTLEPDGKMIINGAQGLSGTPNDSTFNYWFYFTFNDFIYCVKFDSFKDRRAVMAIR